MKHPRKLLTMPVYTPPARITLTEMLKRCSRFEYDLFYNIRQLFPSLFQCSRPIITFSTNGLCDLGVELLTRAEHYKHTWALNTLANFATSAKASIPFKYHALLCAVRYELEEETDLLIKALKVKKCTLPTFMYSEVCNERIFECLQFHNIIIYGDEGSRNSTGTSNCRIM